MQSNDLDSSSSGYLADTFEGISQTFTDVEILHTSEVNIVAKAKRYGRWWLLKGLRHEVSERTAYRQRLRKELEILMALQHPCVVSALGLEEVEGLGLCIVMVYADGVTLKEWLQDHTGRQARKRIVRELIEAVGYIHSKGIVHRDLKLENIIVTHNGTNVKLIDFGLADTDSHAILKQPAGTLNYMSPEQAQMAEADIRNDIYSLGVVLRQMSVGYNTVIKKCLRPIDQRYQSVAALSGDMRSRDKRKYRIAIALVVLLVLTLTGVVWMQTRRVNDFARQAAESRIQQTELQTVIASLADSMEQVSYSHQRLQDRQTAEDAARQRVESTIAKGKALIDKAVINTGIKQHLDTLANFAYFREDIFGRMKEIPQASTQYIEKIKGSFTENEMAEITNALVVYSGNYQKHLMERYSQLKETYDQSIMHGN